MGQGLSGVSCAASSLGSKSSKTSLVGAKEDRCTGVCLDGLWSESALKTPIRRGSRQNWADR